MGAGVLGIFLPILPTTPLLLLAAYLFSRGSPKYRAWLINHKVLGKYIRDYTEKGGLTLKTKITAITLIWLSIVLSVVFLIDLVHARVLLLLIATGVTIYLIRLKTLEG